MSLSRVVLTLAGFAWMLAGQGVGGSGGRKVVMVVGMEGKGSWEDPKRPAVAGAEGVNFRWIPSDDGRFAIVEVELGRVTGEGLRALDQSAGAAVAAFARGQGRKEDVEKEIRKYRKDFDLDEFLAGKKSGGVK